MSDDGFVKYVMVVRPHMLNQRQVRLLIMFLVVNDVINNEKISSDGFPSALIYFDVSVTLLLNVRVMFRS
jgi:hypothetical protein